MNHKSPEPDPAEAVLSSRKYRGLNIPAETAREILESAQQSGASAKEAEKILREKLHNIVAPYLGDPNYATAERDLEAAFLSGDSQKVKEYCEAILSTHASTRERLEILKEFYPRIFEVTGRPASILDLACGWNPFTLPWMSLPEGASYFAYDLNQPRVELTNRFLEKYQARGRAYHADVLIHPPQEKADMAFLFKEAHRMEQRKKGSTRKLMDAVSVEWFLLSLPPNSLHGKYDLAERQKSLVERIVTGSSWNIVEVSFKNEIVFCIRKEDK